MPVRCWTENETVILTAPPGRSRGPRLPPRPTCPLSGQHRQPVGNVTARAHTPTCTNVAVVAPLGRLLIFAASGAAIAASGYAGLVTGALSVDLGLGRRLRSLGPQVIDIAAPRKVVFDAISQPYLGRPTGALAGKIQVLEKGSDMVLAAHFTPVRGRLKAQTVETVRFTPPLRIDCRLVRGPVPHVVEEFTLSEQGGEPAWSTAASWVPMAGGLGQRWGAAVARRWEHAVGASLSSIRAEAERRTAVGRSS